MLLSDVVIVEPVAFPLLTPLDCELSADAEVTLIDDGEEEEEAADASLLLGTDCVWLLSAKLVPLS